MDPLSDVLSLVRLRTYAASGLTAGGRWALHIPAYEGIKCYAITKGACQVVIEGVPRPVHLAAGDCLMLPHGRPFRLCSDVRARPVDTRAFISQVPNNGIRACTPGDDFFLLGGHFALEGDARLLLSVLPPFVHVRQGPDQTSLREPIERMLEELRHPRPGGQLIAQQSASTMLILVLRQYLAQDGRGGVGWLFALGDPRLARALARMHEEPSHDWTVQTLAKTAHMSRTTFAERFRKTVGESPMDYLTRWRMLVAGDRLRQSNDSLSEVARAVGYESESAFGAAFKRTMGTSPRAYARGRDPLHRDVA